MTVFFADKAKKEFLNLSPILRLKKRQIPRYDI